MNLDTSGEQVPSDKRRRHEGVEPSAGVHSQPASVPVFNCIVYISSDAKGDVRARVSNLPGLECTAASERAALGKIVPAFKQRVSELMQSGPPIPWIDPPLPAEPGEQSRFIAVHL